MPRAFTTNEDTTVRSIVSEEKATALNSGAVKDSKSQALSTLVDVGSAAGERKCSVSVSSGAKSKPSAINGPTVTNCHSSLMDN